MALFSLFFGPVPEELGRRGHAYDRLHRRAGPIGARLLLGAAWAVWHLPLYAIPQAPVPTIFPWGTGAFWGARVVAPFAETLVMTWTYHRTGRSTLSAILFHWATNLTGEVLGLRGEWIVYRTAWIVLAGAIATVGLIVAKPNRQKRSPRGAYPPRTATIPPSPNSSSPPFTRRFSQPPSGSVR